MFSIYFFSLSEIFSDLNQIYNAQQVNANVSPDKITYSTLDSAKIKENSSKFLGVNNHSFEIIDSTKTSTSINYGK